MRILDIDLDFFVNPICNWLAKNGVRLNSKEYQPWKRKKVKDFLEINCLLSTKNPPKGRSFIEHHEAFIFWRELIENGYLSIPFEVVHVDAHSDLLGIGAGGWKYLMGEILHIPVKERYYPEEGPFKLNSANYLAFAVACRWISKITFVTHPLWRDDLNTWCLKDFKTSSGFIELKGYKLNELNTDRFIRRYKKIHPTVIEPLIPFKIVNHDQFLNSSPFDFVNLCQSPSFTPPTADRTMALIEKYFRKKLL